MPKCDLPSKKDEPFIYVQELGRTGLQMITLKSSRKERLKPMVESTTESKLPLLMQEGLVFLLSGGDTSVPR